MPTVRENKHAEQPLLARHRPHERAAFSALDGKLPEDVHPEVARFFGLVSGALMRRPPAGVEAVIAYTPVSWALQPSKVTLYTFTKRGPQSERKWNALEPMADAVAEMMAETEVFPMITPVLPDVWERAAEKRSAAFRHIGARGVLVYDRKSLEQSLAGPENGEAA